MAIMTVKMEILAIIVVQQPNVAVVAGLEITPSIGFWFSLLSVAFVPSENIVSAVGVGEFAKE